MRPDLLHDKMYRFLFLFFVLLFSVFIHNFSLFWTQHTIQVRPDLLHDKVEELDAILIEQAKRYLRRQVAPTGFKVWEGLEKDERRRRRARAREESEARERHAQRWMGNVSRKRRRQLVREMVKREREEEEQRELLLRGEEEEEEKEEDDEEEEGACMLMGRRPVRL